MSEEEYSEWDEEEEEVFEILPPIPHQQPAPRKEYPGLSSRKARKHQYADRLRTLLQNYRNVLLLKIDNVGSHQMQKIRMALRGRGILLMGKNSIIRRVLNEEAQNNPKWDNLIPLVEGNVGFCFCNEDLVTVRKIILKYRVPAGAKAGTIAPEDVEVPAGPTGIDPGQTAFFQALNISTKISKGAIEILTDTVVCTAGEKVSASAVVLLEKLEIRPFSYGVVINDVFEDGQVYSASVLDLSEDDLLSKFFRGVNFVAALGLQIGIPNQATLIHNLAHGFRRLLAFALATDYSFEEAKIYKEMLANPDAFKKKDEEEEEEEAEEEEEEEEEDESDGGAGGMFGSDDE